MTAAREFTDNYLSLAGRPTVDLIADAVAVSEVKKLPALADQLNHEIQTMYYTYRGWQKVTARKVTAWLGESAWQAMDELSQQEPANALPARDEFMAQWIAFNTELCQAIEAQQLDKIVSISQSWHDHALIVHDHYMNNVAVLLSEVKRQCGDAQLGELLAAIMDPTAMQLTPEMSFRQRVEAIVSFTRVHLLPFRLIEDDEKVTFIATPCPSGGRQILAGLYESDGAGAVLKGPQPLNYSLAELPVYCCHEPAMEIASIHSFGAPVFVVDPSVELGKTPCHVHIYKRAEELPDYYYQRLGLTRPTDLIAKTVD